MASLSSALILTGLLKLSGYEPTAFMWNITPGKTVTVDTTTIAHNTFCGRINAARDQGRHHIRLELGSWALPKMPPQTPRESIANGRCLIRGSKEFLCKGEKQLECPKSVQIRLSSAPTPGPGSELSGDKGPITIFLEQLSARYDSSKELSP
jgi:hypothetical protein